MSIRDERQKEASDSYLRYKGRRLILAAPRFGKIKTAINVFREMKTKSVLICYPRTEIKSSWEKDFKKWSYDSSEVIYTTYASLHKFVGQVDLVVLDEVQEMSPAQLKTAKSTLKNQRDILCLSGTVTNKTMTSLKYNLDIDPCFEYTIEQAVEEGIISDYEIFVHQVKLDKTKPQYSNKSGGKVSEKKKFDAYMWVKKELEAKKEPYFFLDLKMISIIQNSHSKLMKTRELLHSFRNQRCLVFTGLTSIADQLEVPVYHSKSKNKEVFEDFCAGRNYNHLACVKLVQSGITIMPLSHSIINYTSGNPEDTCQKICRMLNMEYDNLNKKASIHIISTDEEFETDRLTTALSFFDKKKIKIYE